MLSRAEVIGSSYGSRRPVISSPSARTNEILSGIAVIRGAGGRKEGPLPWNAWFYGWAAGDAYEAFIELVPRLTVLAGLELGAGIYINSLDPSEAAARLRAHPSTPATPPDPAAA